MACISALKIVVESLNITRGSLAIGNDTVQTVRQLHSFVAVSSNRFSDQRRGSFRFVIHVVDETNISRDAPFV